MQYEVCGTAHCNTNFPEFSVLYRISFGTNDAVAIIRLKKICTHINFLQAISQSDFVVSMVVLKEVSSLILPATWALQTLGLDVVVAMHTIGDLTKASAGMRCEEVFTNIFTAAENVANPLGIKIARPRIVQTSKNRENSGGTDISPEGHYRLTDQWSSGWSVCYWSGRLGFDSRSGQTKD